MILEQTLIWPHPDQSYVDQTSEHMKPLPYCEYQHSWLSINNLLHRNWDCSKLNRFEIISFLFLCYDLFIFHSCWSYCLNIYVLNLFVVGLLITLMEEAKRKILMTYDRGFIKTCNHKGTKAFFIYNKSNTGWFNSF